MNSDKRYACLTLDLEHDWTLPGSPSDNPTFDYVDEYISIINQMDVPISIFAVGLVIEKFPNIIKKFQHNLDSEFHLHSYRHDVTKSHDFIDEVHDGIAAYEQYFDDRPIGYRAPLGDITDEELVELERNGFEFDSSIFPSYRPGVYNNIRAPNTPYYPNVTDDLLEIPFTVLPRLRIPISQNYLKLFGKLYRFVLRWADLPDLVVFDHHLQDFQRTEFYDHFSSPTRQLMLRNIHNSTDIFRQFVTQLTADGYEFIKISDVYEAIED